MFNNKNSSWKIKNLISNNRLGFKYITKNIANNKDMVVSRDTDIMIEGYPRSGNTFSVAAFELAQDTPVKIARHRHEVGHLRLAMEYNVPIILLVREPLQAVSSFIIRENVNIKFALQYYVEFYEKLLPYKDKMVIADFKQVINDMGSIIKQVNNRFGSNFIPFENTHDNIIKAKENVGKMEQLDSGENVIRDTHVAYPTEKKEKLKKDLIDSIRNEHHSLYLHANDVYQKILNAEQ